MKNFAGYVIRIFHFCAFLMFFLLLQISEVSFGQQAAFSVEDSIEIDAIFSIDDKEQFIESIMPHDLNSDGFEDLLIITNKFEELSASLYVLPGSESGFEDDDAFILSDGEFIRNLQVGDWNGDLEMDLVVEKISSGQESYTEVYIMDGMEAEDTLNFSELNQGYNFTNVVTIVGVEDLNLDGRAEIIYGAYQNLIVGWNNRNELRFEAITTEARNSYRAQLMDINQDGFMDLIVDEQTANAPVVYVNQKDKTFKREILNLPESGPEPEVGNYHLYKPILFNDDIYPDLLVNREVKTGIDTMGYPIVRPQSEIYLYNFEEEVYAKSNFKMDTLSAYDLTYPAHINNDGYLDFLQKTEEKLTIITNKDNEEYSIQEVELFSDNSIWDLTNVDVDQDGDQDILYSEFHETTVYQITNNDTAQNYTPNSPKITEVETVENTLYISWQEGFGTITPHFEYGIKITSEDHNLRLGNVNPVNGNRQTSKVLAGFQKNTVSIPNLPNGTYNIEVTTYNQVGKFSGFGNGKTVTINSTSNEEQPDQIESFKLFQNYPNPFNPATKIKYQLPRSSYVTLEVFDVAGKLVTILVDESQPKGVHEVTFNGEELSSGLYICRMQADGQILTRKLILMK